MAYGSEMTLLPRQQLTTIALLTVLTAAGCSGLDTLDERTLRSADALWRTEGPESYRVMLQVSGTRVDEGIFEVRVTDGSVVDITMNGNPVTSERAGDYSIEGLFGILEQELALAEDPRLLGAPAGYQAYLLARFDPDTGRLEHYRRSVGGASNSIDIEVLEFEAD